MKHVWRALILAGCLVPAFPAGAGFRCGNALVQEGDRKHEVASHCGEPDLRESRAGAYLEGIGPVDVTETWYYDTGPTRLVRILTFHRGRLRSIDTGERGLGREERQRACRPIELAVGMSKYQLLGRCGEPVARESWFAHPGSLFHHHHHHHLHGLVRVEEWTYTFGSNQFRRFVRIVDGRVVAIETGDKGG